MTMGALFAVNIFRNRPCGKIRNDKQIDCQIPTNFALLTMMTIMGREPLQILYHASINWLRLALAEITTGCYNLNILRRSKFIRFAKSAHATEVVTSTKALLGAAAWIGDFLSLEEDDSVPPLGSSRVECKAVEVNCRL